VIGWHASDPTSPDLVTAQRRSVRTLMVGQVLGSAALVSVSAAVGLLTAEMLGSDRLAGLPNTGLTLGTALVATRLARRAENKGRRAALWAGYGVGACGALVAAIAGQVESLVLLLIGMLALGAGQASGLQSRFAAADLAEPSHRARDLARVVWVAAIGGVIGPTLIPLEDRFGQSIGLAAWVAPMVAASILYLGAAAFVAWQLRPDPLLLRQRLGAGPGMRETPRRNLSTAVRAVLVSRRAILAMAAISISQAAMVAVMTMTPLHMRDHGQADLSGLVIAMHVFGMYGMAPLVGRWSDRVGSLSAIRTGGLILSGGVISSVIAGYQPVLIFLGLFLLGLGWNFGLIAGSALLSESLSENVRVAAQGLSDALLSILGAVASLSSGLIKQAAGFHWLANVAAAMTLMMVAAAIVVGRKPVQAG
jgi:MFS family permease